MLRTTLTNYKLVLFLLRSTAFSLLIAVDTYFFVYQRHKDSGVRQHGETPGFECLETILTNYELVLFLLWSTAFSLLIAMDTYFFVYQRHKDSLVRQHRETPGFECLERH